MTSAIQDLACAVAACSAGSADDRSQAERSLGAIVLAAVAGDDADPASLVALGVSEPLVAAAVEELRDVSQEFSAFVRDDDVRVVIADVTSKLGAPGDWAVPTSYESLALATIDSVWSIGVRYAGVLNVIDRYREHRRASGSPCEDSANDLIEVIHAAGGPDGFAELLDNRQRTSSRSGVLKADAVLRCATVLRDHRVDCADDVRRMAPAARAALGNAWRAVPGQRSGLSWDYFLMLIGFELVKGDRMVRRYVARALGLKDEIDVSPERASAIVGAAAEAIGSPTRHLDFAIWSHESALAKGKKDK